MRTRALGTGLAHEKCPVNSAVRRSRPPAPYSPPPQGFRVVLAEDCWMKSLVPLMGEVRQQMGGKPVYITFDIDGLDPAYAPGTGTPEIAGLTPSQVRRFHQWEFLGARLLSSPPLLRLVVSLRDQDGILKSGALRPYCAQG